MKKVTRMDGFAIEVFPSMRPGVVHWCARLAEHPSVHAGAENHEDAIKALAVQWEATKMAYRNSGLPVPTPQRRRGNKRILDTIHRLSKQEITFV